MRTRMTTSAGTTYFHYDENKNVSFETNTSGQVVASYTFDGENRPVSMSRSGQTYYYQLNGHGDVVALTDSTGAVVATYEYDAYGNVLNETGTVENPYRYAGYRYDKVTGLYYLQSRYYNPDTGRFLTRDTFEGFDKQPLSLNKYTYGNNNPVINVDPDGYNPIAIAILAIMRYVGTALLNAWLWTNIYMTWHYGLKRPWPKSVYISNFKWNFASALVFGPGWGFMGSWVKRWLYRTGAIRWLYSKAVRIGVWAATKSYYMANSLRRSGYSWYVAHRLNRSYLGWYIKRTVRNMLYRLRGHRYF